MGGWDNDAYRTPQQAAAHAVYMCLRHKPLEYFTGGEANAPGYCARIIAAAVESWPQLDCRVSEAGREPHRKSIADYLRDIVGNPIQPVAFDPSWRTEAVVALARGMYEARDFAAMPVLADALEDAGCAQPDILAHCRGPGPHVRGCWVVDLVLGKA